MLAPSPDCAMSGKPEHIWAIAPIFIPSRNHNFAECHLLVPMARAAAVSSWPHGGQRRSPASRIRRL
jgi:hypothetical protein